MDWSAVYSANLPLPCNRYRYFFGDLINAHSYDVCLLKKRPRNVKAKHRGFGRVLLRLQESYGIALKWVLNIAVVSHLVLLPQSA